MPLRRGNSIFAQAAQLWQCAERDRKESEAAGAGDEAGSAAAGAGDAEAGSAAPGAVDMEAGSAAASPDSPASETDGTDATDAVTPERLVARRSRPLIPVGVPHDMRPKKAPRAETKDERKRKLARTPLSPLSEQISNFNLEGQMSASTAPTSAPAPIAVDVASASVLSPESQPVRRGKRRSRTEPQEEQMGLVPE